MQNKTDKGTLLVSKSLPVANSNSVNRSFSARKKNCCASSNAQPSILSERSNITNTDLSAIRNLFPETDVITMTYHWLVGVAMTMDSRGIVKRYNYDEFGRLNDVRDYNNYFITQYQYNYKR